jgi:ABC-type Na+ efflux pump permease subunit
MRVIIKSLIVLGSIAAAITGTTVAVKKNKKAGAAYDKHMPVVVKNNLKKVETVTIKHSKTVAEKSKSAWKTVITKVSKLSTMNIVPVAVSFKTPADVKTSFVAKRTAKRGVAAVLNNKK